MEKDICLIDEDIRKLEAAKIAMQKAIFVDKKKLEECRGKRGALKNEMIDTLVTKKKIVIELKEAKGKKQEFSNHLIHIMGSW